MPVRAVRYGSTFVEIEQGGRLVRVLESEVAPGSKDKMALAIKDLLNLRLQTRRRIKDLPDDDQIKTGEEDISRFGERMFKEGRGANEELVSQPAIVTDCWWNGSVYQITIRKAR